jgi:hypothetical protein
MYRSIYQDKIFEIEAMNWDLNAIHAPFVIIFPFVMTLLLHENLNFSLTIELYLLQNYYSNKYSFKRRITGWVIWNIYGLAQYPSSSYKAYVIIARNQRQTSPMYSSQKRAAAA